MKKILLATLCAIAHANYTPNPQLGEQYPFVMWSKTAIPTFSENADQITAASLVEQVHSTVYNEDGSLKATRLFIIRKDGLTTRDTLKAAQYFTYDREVMFAHSVALPWVETEGFSSDNDSLLSKSLGVQASEYQLDSADEIPVLAEQLAADTSATLRVDIINMKWSLGNNLINEVSMQVQEAVAKTGAVSSHIMALTGRKGSEEQVDPIISLQQTLAATSPVKAAVVSVSSVKNYVTHNIMAGILIMLFMAMVAIIGFLQLMVVQTPTYYPLQSIDFGKIEQ